MSSVSPSHVYGTVPGQSAVDFGIVDARMLIYFHSANLPSLEAVETRASAILEEVQSHIDPPEDRTLAEHITSQIASLHQSNSTLLALHSSILSLLASPIPSPQLSFPPRATKAAEMTLATETLFAAASKFDLVSRTAATSHLLPPNSEASLVPRLGALHRKEVEEMRREVERLEEILQGYDSQMMGDVGVGNRSSKGEKSFTTVLNEYRALGVEEKEIRGDLKRFHR